jgi:hypothetical protein
MTREEQLVAALVLLPDRREDIEHALDIMDAATRAVAHARVTKKERRAYSASLRRLAATTRATIDAGGAVALPKSKLDHLIEFDADWSAHWSPPSRWLKQQTAVALAYDLLDGDVPLSRVSPWHRLAGVLLGDPAADLFRQMRAYSEIRSRRK